MKQTGKKNKRKKCPIINIKEREGFEPSVQKFVQRISNPTL